MRKCPIHGKLKTEWCDDCGKIYPVCDCSDKTTTRFKDLIIECNDGEKTITIYVVHCDTCGKIFNIRNDY